jgi:hypothetical protein
LAGLLLLTAAGGGLGVWMLGHSGHDVAEGAASLGALGGIMLLVASSLYARRHNEQESRDIDG